MNLRLLIDGIVRQTTVLIAQLSTTSGVRSPLVQVADQVFLQLSRELESQGVTRAVAADMFGMALRAYQKKIARVAESASVQGMTLWEAIYDFVETESPTRSRLLERFRNDGEREVLAVLRDLVSNGMVFVTGEGANAAYGITSERMQSQVLQARDFEATVHVVWLKVFQGVGTAAELATSLGIAEEEVRNALDELHKSGRIKHQEGRWSTRRVHIPMGAVAGTEAAMLDHFRAVCNVLTARSRASLEAEPDASASSKANSGDGGSTFCFAIHPGHPHEQEVLNLLKRSRTEVQRLWDAVAAHNQAREPEPDTRYVTFYCGQVTAGTDDGSETKE
ncbi:MAG TPA: hypothetical protein VHM70_08330 [Polyangiaceae bacterium]|jgi:DNA-binding Lrp family transcriptional regulator|nr:hypothetical protein [Polyangiaceae bacterium]